MRPSQPGYNFSAADLARASLQPDELSRIIFGVQGTDANGLPIEALQLLAQIAKNNAIKNATYRPGAINFPAWHRQLLFTENPNRSYLIIQNVGSGDLMVVFEDGPASILNQSSADGQTFLTQLQTRALRIVAGGYYEPLIPPKNNIAIFTLGTATNGVAIEGS